MTQRVISGFMLTTLIDADIFVRTTDMKEYNRKWFATLDVVRERRRHVLNIQSCGMLSTLGFDFHFVFLPCLSCSFTARSPDAA